MCPKKTISFNILVKNMKEKFQIVPIYISAVGSIPSNASFMCTMWNSLVKNLWKYLRFTGWRSYKNRPPLENIKQYLSAKGREE